MGFVKLSDVLSNLEEKESPDYKDYILTTNGDTLARINKDIMYQSQFARETVKSAAAFTVNLKNDLSLEEIQSMPFITVNDVIYYRIANYNSFSNFNYNLKAAPYVNAMHNIRYENEDGIYGANTFMELNLVEKTGYKYVDTDSKCIISVQNDETDLSEIGGPVSTPAGLYHRDPTNYSTSQTSEFTIIRLIQRYGFDAPGITIDSRYIPALQFITVSSDGRNYYNISVDSDGNLKTTKVDV